MARSILRRALFTCQIVMFLSAFRVTFYRGSRALPHKKEEKLRLIKAWVTLPLTHTFHKIENNLAILRGIFLILGRNVYHYHLSRTTLWQLRQIR